MKNKQKGFSLIELLIVVAIILIIAAIAIPNLLRARIAANEASAVSSLRTMNTACITYDSTYGTFPSAQSKLGPVAGGATPNSTTADLLDILLAPASGSATKSGYTITYTAGTADAQGNFNDYHTTAVPSVQNTTGVREFYSDQSGVIRFSIGAAADQSSSPLGN